MKRPRETYLVIAVGALFWCSGIFLAPLFASAGQGSSPLSEILYGVYHQVCHQFDARSFHISGEPLAVCVRCVSIYVAFLIGVLFYPVLAQIPLPRIPPRSILIGAAIPLFLDVAAGILGVYEVSTLTRVLTGSFFGIVAPFYVIPVATDAMRQFHLSRSPSTDVS